MSEQEVTSKRPAEDVEVEETSTKRPRVEEPSTNESANIAIPTPTPTPEEGSASAPASGSTTIITTPSSTPIPLPIIPPQESQTTSVRFKDHLNAPHRTIPEPISRLGLKPVIPILPDSLEYIIGEKIDLTERKGFAGELECGIRGFVGLENKGVRGVIKQRFTDFIVNEISLDGTVLHLKDITKPSEPESEKPKPTPTPTPSSTTEPASKEDEEEVDISTLPEPLQFAPHPQWSTSTTVKLRNHLSDESIVALYGLLVEGKELPPKSDGGWGSRKPKAEKEEGTMNEEEMVANASSSTSNTGGRGQGRDRGRGRDVRGDRRDGKGAQGGWKAQDTREVVSQPITSKDARTAAHKVLRECFGTTFDSSTRETPGEEGSRLVIKYSSGQGGRGGNGTWQRQPDRPKLPPYIHFTLHKTNRETMDALSHITRMLGAHPKDLSVCGTKDKRAVTVQRVCFKRNNKNLTYVWKSVNGIRQGRRNEQKAIEERGERGVRIGDLEYSKQYLELGMLKGNQFVITLRNVQEENREEINKTMKSVRDNGFINFYGMQRFGTSSWPTHLTGLLILQSKWSEAVDSILHLREGEHPDCTSARLAWLEDKDPKKAFDQMPRRGVAERCIWDFWTKNRVEDKVGALSSIPRNLRVMYVHAYQSYIWNIIVSERIRLSSTEPLVGDLVFVDKDTLGEGDVPNPDSVPAHAKDRKGRPLRKWATTSSPEVKQLTEEDLPNHTIFDVVMPLPGWDVDYPGGSIGEKYAEALKRDGLDIHKMRRDQRDFSLPGSYRRMIIRPISLNWNHLTYTDPDVSLVQSDEDEILGQNPPPEDIDSEEGKFRALKIELELGSATYATMVLREITREETSTWHQIGLTMNGEDREYKGSTGVEKEEKDEEGEEDAEREGDIDM
ncbi:tRNA pseudouridine13 synthase [Kwoniella mangroviensis CBS 8886]|nr:tRNA pseudouridine13 synthase [Kwoniella mangroviensis CBS 8886]